MTYLIGEIALFLLLALALGLVVGWLLRGLVASRADRPESDRPPKQPEVSQVPEAQPETSHMPEPEPESAEQTTIWP
ncbi:MAG: hypothetical protein ACE5MI_00475 [Acidimicrobiia bacterium]